MKWINGQYSLGLKYRGKIGRIQNAVPTVKEEDRKSCHEDLTTMSSTIFGNTIRKQITGPTWEAKRHRKITIDRSGNTEKWTAVKGF